jgi:hypothetical protein
VAGPTHEISGLCSLLVRVVGYKVDENLNLRLGEETKGQQVENTRCKGCEWSYVRLRTPRLRIASCWALWNNH